MPFDEIPENMRTYPCECGGEITDKKVKCKISKNYPGGSRTDHVYHFCNEKYGAGDFEHIADACGVIEAAKGGVLVRRTHTVTVTSGRLRRRT